MKGIAIETTWFLVIVLVSIIVGLSIILALRERISQFFYCNLYLKIFPSQQIPEFCKVSQPKTERTRIFANNSFEAISKFAEYILDCWKLTEKYKIKEDYMCYELEFSLVPEDLVISAENLSKYFKDYYNCQEIQMKSYGCGYRDDIIWNVKNEIILKGSIVLIVYRAEEDKIEIIS